MNNYKDMILPMALSIVLLGCSSSASLAVSKDSSTTSPEKQEIIVVDNDKKSKVPEKGKEAEIEESKQQDKIDEKMIKASNEIEGVEIDPSKFKEEKGFQWKHLNPMHWVFKPVTDMQDRVIHLEKQIMRLEGPIANLQKPMVGLREDMGTVETKMDSIGGGMSQVNGHMHKVNGQMQSVNDRMGHVEKQLDKMYEPVVNLQSPVSNVSGQLTSLKKDLKELKDVVSLTSTLILVAVISVGLLVAVGTPIAALFAWRHRRFIIEKLGKGDYEDVPMTEEESEDSKYADSVTSYTR